MIVNKQFISELLFWLYCTGLNIHPSSSYQVKGRVAHPEGELKPFDKTGSQPSHLSVCTASINVTSVAGDVATNATVLSATGQYSTRSALYSTSARLLHVVDASGAHDGCETPVNAAGEPWIALVSRGACKFDHKLETLAAVGNVLGVIVYNHVEEESLLMMDTRDHDIVSVFVHKSDGDMLIEALELEPLLLASIALKDITVLEVGMEEETLSDGSSHTSLSSVIFLIAGLIFVSILVLATIVACSFKSKIRRHRRRSTRAKLSGLSPQQVLYSVRSETTNNRKGGAASPLASHKLPVANVSSCVPEYAVPLATIVEEDDQC